MAVKVESYLKMNKDALSNLFFLCSIFYIILVWIWLNLLHGNIIAIIITSFIYGFLLGMYCLKFKEFKRKR